MKRLNKGFGGMVFYAAVLLCILTLFCAGFVGARDVYKRQIYYTFFYSLSLFLFGFALLTFLENKTGRRRVYAFLACLFGAIVGGGNYPTALLSTLVLVLMAVLLAIGKNARWRSLLPALLFLLASFLLSIVAPGNAVRGAYYEGDVYKRQSL